MQFDMTKFKARARRYIKKTNASPVTVSKKIFGNNANTLEGVLDGTVSPRFDTLIKADKLLSELETRLGQAA